MSCSFPRRLAWTAAAALAGLALAPVPANAQEKPQTPPSLARYVYPLAKPRPAPLITIDVSDAPATRPWAEAAPKLAADWFPTVCQLLATEDFKPPREIKLVFKKDLSAPAYTAGGVISINGQWITAHPDDLGMVIHEMTHVVQAYPHNPGDPGWLVEGIADYVRWWRYEPEAPRSRINPATASYRDAYRTTAAFLAWIVAHKDKRIVHNLDDALRHGRYSDVIFEQTTGENVDALWAEYVATIR